ncbi:hypothetical protein BCR33DRAFT_215863 [Rhizoclosmatium globosum]|uniref:NACHT domain-containing protein n=1 Tax=Rhizoclosmatium globosum TaxID=329046 RepID=A0A1Y2AGK7_9FUNG|nr:hypothetical protein BCR33DRAFT_215863 [Rhizoclosmatium globosum]|eukprot:ORY21085.1 hypothetical protein BCR33DRAFT_215863 [Rhizoclosmatium globosum]
MVIDAIDELKYETRQVLLTILTEFGPKLPSFVKIFLTGRPEKDIYDCLTELSSYELSPTNENNLIDVQIVVKQRLKELWNIETFELPAAALVAMDLIVSKSEGLLIFVKVVFSSYNLLNMVLMKL